MVYEMIVYNNDGEYFTRVIVKDRAEAIKVVRDYNKKFHAKYSGKVVEVKNGKREKVMGIIEHNGKVIGWRE